MLLNQHQQDLKVIDQLIDRVVLTVSSMTQMRIHLQETPEDPDENKELTKSMVFHLLLAQDHQGSNETICLSKTLREIWHLSEENSLTTATSLEWL